jgi:hypothetical protein
MYPPRTIWSRFHFDPSPPYGVDPEVVHFGLTFLALTRDIGDLSRPWSYAS